MVNSRITSRLPAAARRSLALVGGAAPRELAAVAVLQVVGALCLVGQVLLLRRVLAAVLGSARQTLLGHIVAELVALAAVSAVSAVASGLAAERQRFIVERVRRHATQRILAVTSSVDLSAFETADFNDSLSRARQQALVRPPQVVAGLLGALGTLLSGIALTVTLAGLAPLLLPVIAMGVVPTLLLLRSNSRDLHAVDRRLATSDRERWYLEDILSSRGGAKEVRTFRLPSFLGPLHDELANARVEAYRSLIRRRSWRVSFVGALSALVTGAGVAVLVALVTSGRTTPATAATAALVATQLATTLRAAGGAAGQVYENSLFLAEVDAFFSAWPTTGGERRALPGGPVQLASLAVRNLSFTYPGTDREVLHDVSLDIPAGQVVAVIGENGSGKTTFTKLLTGLYRPGPGRLLWLGSETTDDASTVAPDSWRARFGVVFQDFVHYELSARLNVAVGRHDRSDDLAAVRRAAQLADADRFLMDLPDGYATLLSRAYAGGAELSLGQWQRLALARAFFSDAPVLVLDEPTSALDPRVEQELLRRVQALRGRKTVVLISHRLSSVRFADQIFVLRHGVLEEAGTHDELMAQKGHYAELFELQAAAYRAEAKDVP